MKGLVKHLILTVITFNFLTACTEPGETTGLGAATGGAIGAGVGAIVGSQTGDAGAGLVIGSVAGAGTGALVGNALEAQQKAIQGQDEAIERQQQLIRAQKAEIEELRRLSQDNVSFKATETFALNNADAYNHGSVRSLTKQAPTERSIINEQSEQPVGLTQNHSADKTVSYLPRQPEGALRPERNPRSDSDRSAATLKPQFEQQPKVQERANYRWQQQNSQIEEKSRDTTKRAIGSNENLSPACQEAQTEVQKATHLNDIPEQLLHYRRALRLCPEKASLHNGLGEIYVALQRTEDAQFEFQEALRLDPNYRPARLNLESLKSTGQY